MLANLKNYWKLLSAAGGALGMGIAFVLHNFAGVLPLPVAAGLGAVLGLLGLFGVYRAPGPNTA